MPPTTAAPSQTLETPGKLPDLHHVTVVIPTYNRPEGLRRCLLGLLACQADGVEVDVWIIDDGSTDSPAGVIDEIRARYDGPMRLHYLRQENQGHSAAVNTGVAQATTDVVLILDDDCVPELGWLRALLRAEWTPTTGVVGGKIVSAEQRTVVSRYCRFLKFNEFPPNDKPLEFVNSANSAYLREGLNRVGGFETLIRLGGEDIEVSWRLRLEGYTLVYQPEAVVRHYHRESFRVLMRTIWQRGYASTLRNALWKQNQVSWGRLGKELYRQFFWGLMLFTLPLGAVKMLRRGVPPRDAVPFAVLDWLRPGVNRAGKMAMLLRILTGRQSLERSSRLPENAADLAPLWAKDRDTR